MYTGRINHPRYAHEYLHHITIASIVYLLGFLVLDEYLNLVFINGFFPVLYNSFLQGA